MHRVATSTPERESTASELSQRVARNVIQTMQTSDKSLVDLAAGLRVHPRDLADALGGHRDFTLTECAMIAHMLRVDISALLTEGDR